MKRIDVFGVAVPLLLLAACATSEPASAPQPPQVETTFTPFHELPGGAAGRSFFMQPAEAQESSLAWATYANQVALGLEDHGLRRVQSATGADYAVSFSYGTGTGWAATAVGGRAAAPSGNGSRTSVYTIGDQTFTTVTALPPASAQAPSRAAGETEHRPRLEVTMLDVAKSRAGGKRVVVYEVGANSRAANANIHAVLPAMITAVFATWPGHNGEPETWRIPMK